MFCWRGCRKSEGEEEMSCYRDGVRCHWSNNRNWTGEKIPRPMRLQWAAGTGHGGWAVEVALAEASVAFDSTSFSSSPLAAQHSSTWPPRFLPYYYFLPSLPLGAPRTQHQTRATGTPLIGSGARQWKMRARPFTHYLPIPPPQEVTHLISYCLRSPPCL